MIHKCSYCLAQSHLFDVDVVVIPWVFMRVDMDSSHSQGWLLMEHFGGPVTYLLDLGYQPHHQHQGHHLYHQYQCHLDMSDRRMVKAQHASYLSAWKERWPKL